MEFGPIPDDVFTEDKKFFAKDFWMKGRVGAMAGASTNEYNTAQIVLGMLGGTKPKHMHILGPDVENLSWNEVMTSPGSNGWMPEGADYYWHRDFTPSQNFQLWVELGCPKSNQHGNWANNGYPLEYLQETWRGVNDRDLSQFCAKYGLGCKERKKQKH